MSKIHGNAIGIQKPPEQIYGKLMSLSDAARALPNVLQQAGLCAATPEVRRMIAAGAVRVDQERVSDSALELEPGSSAMLQVGKRRAARVRLADG